MRGFVVLLLAYWLWAPAGAAQADTADDTLLWYDAPAGQNWLAALPLGNGRIGAMAFGNPDREQVGLNEDTFYALEPETCMYLPDVKGDLPQVLALLKQGRHREAEERVRSAWLGRSNAPYQPMGDLFVEDATTGATTNYRRQLDLADAVAQVDFQRAGIRYRRETFVSQPDQVLVMRLTADRPGSISLAASLDTPHKPTSAWRTVGNHTLVLRGQGPGEALRRDLVKNVEAWGDQRKYPAFYQPDGQGGWKRKFDDPSHRVLYGDEVDGRGMFFECRVRCVCEGGQASTADRHVRVEKADAVTLLLSAATSFNGFDKSPSRQGVDPAIRAARDIEQAAIRPYAELRARHVADHRRLFSRVAIRLAPSTPQSALPTNLRIARYANGSDPNLAALYYQFSRYLMIAGSRSGTQPLNLQGIWNRDVIPPWNCGYTVNINTEMNYWNAGRGNLLECEEPLLRLIREATVTGRGVAAKVFGARGWCMSHNCSIWREAAPVDGRPTASWWPMAGAWFCQHFWQHYEYTQDTAFLRDAYPILKGASEFFLDWLVDRGDGKLVTPVSTSPENTFRYREGDKVVSSSVTMGSTMDRALIRELFTNTGRAAELLGQDEAFRNTLRQATARLPGYQVGRHGQLQEWDQDFDEAEPKHRHLSHLYGFFPGDEITPEHLPEIAKAVRTTLERRGDEATGWSLAWKMCLWARLGDGARVHKLLSTLLSSRYTTPNLFDLCPPFQIDGNFGAGRGIIETLLQDHRGRLDLLPALPPAWSTGSVTGLRARGGFEIAMTWREGRLQQAMVRRVAGDGPVTLAWNGQQKTAALKAGEQFIWKPDHAGQP